MMVSETAQGCCHLVRGMTFWSAGEACAIIVMKGEEITDASKRPNERANDAVFRLLH
jgi:hypothetical protein